MTYVYCVKCPMSGMYKFGKAEDVRRRLSGLNIGHPYDLELVGYFPEDNVSEKEIHFALAPARQRGEWFCPAPPVEELVSAFRTKDISRAKKIVENYQSNFPDQYDEPEQDKGIRIAELEARLESERIFRLDLANTIDAYRKAINQFFRSFDKLHERLKAISDYTGVHYGHHKYIFDKAESAREREGAM